MDCSSFMTSKQISILPKSIWSNKFKVSKNKLVNEELNKKLRSVINTNDWSYGINTNKFLSVLKNEELAEYQYQLLKKYFKSPEKHLKLDCDRLVITFKCTQNDLDLFINDIKKFSINSLSDAINIRGVPVGNINSGRFNNKRPYYSKAYKFKIGNDKRKFMQFYIAEERPFSFKEKDKKTGKETGKTINAVTPLGIRFDFIPNRFSSFELSMLFTHFRSILKHNRYLQFVNNARVTRVDVAFNMAGVFSPFTLATTRRKHVTASSDFPIDSDEVSETVYVGKKGKSTHVIVYDKLLKEFKTDLKDGYPLADVMKRFNESSVVTRIEERFYPYRSKFKIDGKEQPFLLKDLALAPIRLDFLRVIDPRTLVNADDTVLKQLLTNRTHTTIKKLLPVIRKSLPKGKRIKRLRLDEEWLNEGKQELLSSYLTLIQFPEKVTDSNVTEYIEKNNLHIKAEKKQTVVDECDVIISGKLNAQQKAAVHAKEKHVLVVAGAGTGKTRTIVDRVRYMLDSLSIDNRSVQVLAYTNITCEELGNRINKPNMLNGKVSVSTFSSWSGRILKTFLEAEYGENNVMHEDAQVVEKMKCCCKHLTDKSLHKTAINALSFSKNRLLSLEKTCREHFPELLNELSALRAVRKQYKKFKQKEKLFDFDDLIYLAYKHLKADDDLARKVAKKFKHLVIDEMQDSNPLQWKLLLLLTDQGTHLFCVGDPAQSIYGFRGASYEKLETFDKYSSNSKTYYLKDNYRATKSIVELGNYVRHQVNPKYVAINALKGDGDMPLLYEFSKLDSVSLWLRRDLLQRLNHEPQQRVRILVIKNSVVDKLDKVLRENDKIAQLIDKNRIIIQTMHKAKGTESDICYVIDPRFTNNWKNPKAEVLRLLYVALTRAKSQLIICNSMSGKVDYSDSLDDIYLLNLIATQDELYTFRNG
jgi:DNA helicase-2/ATP-dependent DNA helicase PcrA